MAKLFYDHLLVIEEVVAVLDKHTITKDEKEKFVALIDETLHHHILDEILTHLPHAHHEEFLQKLVSHPYDPGIMKYLKEKTAVDIEIVIVKRANAVKKTLIKEINAALATQSRS